MVDLIGPQYAYVRLLHSSDHDALTQLCVQQIPKNGIVVNLLDVYSDAVIILYLVEEFLSRPSPSQPFDHLLLCVVYLQYVQFTAIKQLQ